MKVTKTRNGYEIRARHKVEWRATREDDGRLKVYDTRTGTAVAGTFTDLDQVLDYISTLRMGNGSPRGRISLRVGAPYRPKKGDGHLLDISYDKEQSTVTFRYRGDVIATADRRGANANWFLWPKTEALSLGHLREINTYLDDLNGYGPNQQVRIDLFPNADGEFIIPDKAVVNHWRGPDQNTIDEVVTVHPDWYAENGTPVVADDDMEYEFTSLDVQALLDACAHGDLQVKLNQLPIGPAIAEWLSQATAKTVGGWKGLVHVAKTDEAKKLNAEGSPEDILRYLLRQGYTLAELFADETDSDSCD